MVNLSREETKKAIKAGVAEAFGSVAELEVIKAKGLITPAEAAKILPWSINALQKMREVGKGPAFVKFGRRTYYSPAALSAFLKEHQVKTRDQQ